MSKKETETRTPVSKLGKYNLTERLAARFTVVNDSTLQGYGDDAAVAFFMDPLSVSAQQLALEGVDFDLSYVPLKFIGYKTAIGAMGQVMAMNAVPVQLLVNIGVSQRFFVEDIDAIFEGISALCRRYSVDIAAIDVQSSYTGLSLAVTAIGQAEPGLLTRRSGAQENDLICLSGNVGAAYMGLRLLEREKRVFTGETENDALPNLNGYEYILERYLKPELPSALLENLRRDDLIPTSMCLLKNGLAHSILNLCKASGKGARLFVNKIPIARQCFEFAGTDPSLSPLVAALNGGDDYEMLFTLPLNQYEKVQKEYNLDTIGHICDVSSGCKLITPDGQELTVESPGM